MPEDNCEVCGLHAFEGHTCLRCNTPVHLDYGHECDGYCDGCAHDLFHEAVVILRGIEWGATRINWNTEEERPACPECGGVSPSADSYPKKEKGHQRNCVLGAFLADRATIEKGSLK